MRRLTIEFHIDDVEDFIDRSGVDNYEIHESFDSRMRGAIHNAFWQGDEWGYEIFSAQLDGEPIAI